MRRVSVSSYHESTLADLLKVGKPRQETSTDWYLKLLTDGSRDETRVLGEAKGGGRGPLNGTCRLSSLVLSSIQRPLHKQTLEGA